MSGFESLPGYIVRYWQAQTKLHQSNQSSQAYSSTTTSLQSSVDSLASSLNSESIAQAMDVPAEAVLNNLGFGGDASFLPARFTRDWCAKVIKARDKKMEQLQQFGDEREEAAERRRKFSGDNRKSGKRYEAKRALFKQRSASMGSIQHDEKTNAEKYARMVKQKRKAKFSSNRQMSLPVTLLETLREEDSVEKQSSFGISSSSLAGSDNPETENKLLQSFSGSLEISDILKNKTEAIPSLSKSTTLQQHVEPAMVSVVLTDCQDPTLQEQSVFSSPSHDFEKSELCPSFSTGSTSLALPTNNSTSPFVLSPVTVIEMEKLDNQESVESNSATDNLEIVQLSAVAKTTPRTTSLASSDEDESIVPFSSRATSFDVDDSTSIVLSDDTTCTFRSSRKAVRDQATDVAANDVTPLPAISRFSCYDTVYIMKEKDCNSNRRTCDASVATDDKHQGDEIGFRQFAPWGYAFVSNKHTQTSFDCPGNHNHNGSPELQSSSATNYSASDNDESIKVTNDDTTAFRDPLLENLLEQNNALNQTMDRLAKNAAFLSLNQNTSIV